MNNLRLRAQDRSSRGAVLSVSGSRPALVAQTLRWLWTAGRTASARSPTGMLYALLIGVIVICDLPLIWMVLSAVKPEQEIINYPPTLYPHSISTQSVQALFTETKFAHYLVNTTVVAGSATLMAVVLGLFAAYALVRFEFAFLRGMGEIALLTYTLPPVLLVVPVAQMVLSSGLGNNLLVLAIIYAAQQLPFALWMLRAYLRGITVELEQAAMVDGCTRFGAFLRVVAPEALPGVIAVGVFTFNAAWSEYLFSSLLVTDSDSLTLAPGMALLVNFSGPWSWGVLMAASVIATLPALVLFIAAQRQLVSAWGEGAIKG